MTFEEAKVRINELRSNCKTCFQHALMTETEEYQKLKEIILEHWSNTK